MASILPKDSGSISYSSSLRLLVMILFIFAIGSFGGFWSANLLRGTRAPAKVTSLGETPKKLPVSQKILQSPLLSNWSAGVAGKVIEKDSNSFTIVPITRKYGPGGELTITEVKSGQVLKIRVVEGQTIIREEPRVAPGAPASPSSQFTFKDLALGKVVSGNIKIQRKGRSWEAIGGAFMVVQ